MNPPVRLAAAIATLSAITTQARPGDSSLHRAATVALGDLLRDTGWLTPAMKAVDAAGYRRQLLYQAPDGAFSIGCFAWDRGQRTPIHDHRCWGLTGVVQGSLLEETFTLAGGRLKAGPARVIARGHSAWSRPEGDDIHRVGAAGGLPALSLHLYGAAFDRVCRTMWEEEA